MDENQTNQNPPQQAQFADQPVVQQQPSAPVDKSSSKNPGCSKIFVIFLFIFLEVALIGAVAYFSYNFGKVECEEATTTTTTTTTTTQETETTTTPSQTTTTTTSAEPSTEKYIEEIDYQGKSPKEALLELSQRTGLPMIYFKDYEIEGKVIVNYVTSEKKDSLKPFQQYDSAWVVISMLDEPSYVKGVIGYYETGGTCFKEWNVKTGIGNYVICKADETEEDYSFYLENNFKKNEDADLPVYRFFPTDLTLTEIKELLKTSELIK